MVDLIVLGFENRDAAEEARRRGVRLDREGALGLNAAALAYRRTDGEIDLVQPIRLASSGAVSGAVGGSLIGLVVLAPMLFTALGAAAGAAGAGLSAGVLNALFVRRLRELLQPGRAALFLVVTHADDPSRVIEALRPLSPEVLRTTLDETTQRRLIATFSEEADAGDSGRDSAPTGPEPHAGPR